MKFTTMILVSIFVSSLIRAADAAPGDAPAGTRTDTNATASPTDGDVSFAIESQTLYRLHGLEKTAVPLPGPAVAFLRHGALLYVAVGEIGVCVLRLDDTLTPTLEKRIPISHGTAVGLFEADGEVWMKIDTTTAVRLARGTTAEPMVAVPDAPAPEAVGPKEAKTPPAATATSPGEGAGSKPALDIHIVDVMPGVAKLDAGKNLGIKNGDTFEVYRRSLETKADGVAYAREERVAILEIIAVSETTALAALHRGERVARKDVIVRQTSDETPSKMFPRRLDGVGEVAFNLRPIINVDDEGGGGALTDLTATYFGSFFFAGIRLQPFGFGWTRDGGVVSTALMAEAGYDRKEFALGLGFGFGATSGSMDEMIGGFYGYYDETNADGTGVHSKWADRKTMAVALGQVIRLGPKDGLNLTVVNRLMYYKPSDRVSSEPDPYDEYGEKGFKYAGTTARIAIPLTQALDLVTEGGGGMMGYAFGAIGVSAWIRGRGDAGAIAISASAGGASVWGDYKDKNDIVERVRITGPLLGLGIKARFGSKHF